MGGESDGGTRQHAGGAEGYSGHVAMGGGARVNGGADEHVAGGGGVEGAKIKFGKPSQMTRHAEAVMNAARKYAGQLSDDE